MQRGSAALFDHDSSLHKDEIRGKSIQVQSSLIKKHFFTDSRKIKQYFSITNVIKWLEGTFSFFCVRYAPSPSRLEMWHE